MKADTAVFHPGGNPLADPAFGARRERVDGIDYAHACGRIRALEPSLMDTARTLRLTEARDTVEFSRMLAEAGYPPAQTNGRSLNAGYARACTVAREVAVEKEYIDLFYLENDVINAKVFVKHKALGGEEPYEHLETRIAAPSSVPPERLFEAIRDDDPEGAHIPEWLWTAIRASWSEYLSTGEGTRVDIRLNQAYAAEAVRVADFLGNPWFRELAAVRADLENLGMILRTRRGGFPLPLLRDSLLPGGHLEAETLVAMAQIADDAQLTAAWQNTPYAAIASEAVSGYGRPGGAARFGKLSDDTVMDHVRKARAVSFGPEVPVAYVCAMQTEVQNARIVLAFIRNKLDPAGARELLRKTYL